MFKSYALFSACFFACFLNAVVPLLEVVKQHDGFVLRAVDVICDLICYVLDGFFVKWMSCFMLGKWINLIKL